MWAFRFNGRASRGDWWTVWLIGGLVADLAIVVGAASAITYLGTPNWPLIAAVLVAALAIWPTIAVTAQRFRDRGEPPWLALLNFVPVAGWLWVIIACGIVPNTNYRIERKRVESGRSTEEYRE